MSSTLNDTQEALLRKEAIQDLDLSQPQQRPGPIAAAAEPVQIVTVRLASFRPSSSESHQATFGAVHRELHFLPAPAEPRLGLGEPAILCKAPATSAASQISPRVGGSCTSRCATYASICSGRCSLAHSKNGIDTTCQPMADSSRSRRRVWPRGSSESV